MFVACDVCYVVFSCLFMLLHKQIQADRYTDTGGISMQTQADEYTSRSGGGRIIDNTTDYPWPLLNIQMSGSTVHLNGRNSGDLILE